MPIRERNTNQRYELESTDKKHGRNQVQLTSPVRNPEKTMETPTIIIKKETKQSRTQQPDLIKSSKV
jgi:hypothetical protein